MEDEKGWDGGDFSARWTSCALLSTVQPQVLRTTSSHLSDSVSANRINPSPPNLQCRYEARFSSWLLRPMISQRHARSWNQYHRSVSHSTNESEATVDSAGIALSRNSAFSSSATERVNDPEDSVDINLSSKAIPVQEFAESPPVFSNGTPNSVHPSLNFCCYGYPAPSSQDFLTRCSLIQLDMADLFTSLLVPDSEGKLLPEEKTPVTDKQRGDRCFGKG